MRQHPTGEFPVRWRGADTGEWSRRLGVPQLEIHSRLSSTNDRLRELARDGAPPLTTVVSDTQVAGRGRSGRRWHSASESGLWLSVLLGGGPGGGPGVLTLAVGMAVAQAIEDRAEVGTLLKWPNDVLCGEKKVAGVLCEATGDGGGRGGPIVAGIGINLRRPVEALASPLLDAAGFLEEISSREISEPELARAVVFQLTVWADPAPERLEGRLRDEWDRRDALAGAQVALDDGGGGLCRGVASDGSLRIESEDGSVQSVRTGSVRRTTGTAEGQ